MPLKLHRQSALWLLPALWTAAPATLAVAPDRPVHPYREGELIVEYRAGAPAELAQQFRSRLGLARKRSLRDGRAELVSLPSFTTVASALRVVAGDPLVARAEPNFLRMPRAFVPDDPSFGDQWGLRNIGQANFVSPFTPGAAGADLNMAAAWDADNDGVADRTGSRSVVVAVIDDAVDTDHPDLAPNIVGGRNFIACQDASNPNPVSSYGSHGTRVAGCVAARGNDGYGVAGVAWQAGLLPLKFAFDTATHIAALDYARSQGVAIVNASFGGPGYSQIEADAIAALAASDILYVAAAGNDDSNLDVSKLAYPANYDLDHIVAVAATNRADNIASFSQYGPLSTDVAAPGLQIVTTAVGGGVTGSPGTSGTSFAAPYASGVAALLKAHVSPAPGWREIKARLVESGTAVPGANPEQRTAGGRIDADAALDMAPRPSLVLRSVEYSEEGNDALDPGETLDVVFTVRNAWLAATGVSATLAATGPVTVNSGAQALGNLGPDAEAIARFSVTVANGIADHRYVVFTLTLTADGGYTTARSFIGEIGALVPGTPASTAFTDDLYDDFHAWHVDVPPTLQPGVRTLVIRTSGTAGKDIDLLARRDTPPQYEITVGINPETTFGFFCTSGTTDTCRDPDTHESGRLDGDEAITVVDPPAATYHLVVVNFVQDAVPYTLQATLVNGDLQPGNFDFRDRTGIAPNTDVISNAITVTNIDVPTFITVVGGQYSIDSGPFTAAEGTVSIGQTVEVKVNSGSSGSARAQVTIGGVTDTFAVNPPSPPGGASGDTACPAPPRRDDGGGTPGPHLLLGLLLGALLRRRRCE